ncbi:dihydroorotase [Pilimelia anulata]|uniref:Dihydroorotase n=1 Tax=Pilimelia anulata TaxID=53371 RepID=A0A8J3B9D6_9ACTN|nr:dihydroorotase [Pilimelia anulata]GGJ86584.1 dihydroorotase [Pilimelia anulata]
MNHHLIRGARIAGGEPVDLLLRDGVVAGVGSGLSAAGATVVDADGLIALPGLVDLHTHLREPGREDAETVESGSRAAALGGYTAVCAMANTDPVADNPAVVEQVWRRGREVGLVDVQPIGAVSVGLAGQRLAALGDMADSPARVRIFSDDGICVHDPQLMRRALEYVKAFDGIIAQHAEEPRLTEGAQMHEGEVSARLGLGGWPAVAEEAIIARDVLLAEHVDSRLHVCHVSTAGSVDILRHARNRPWVNRGAIPRVTAEVCPHHLLLTHERAGTYDPVYKVNPPLRTDADVAALRRALVDGVIDVVATDHAPHASHDKECEWAAARPGMLGLETALSIVLHALRAEGLAERALWELVAQRMSRAPARIAGLDEHGHDPAPGRPANLTLVDPEATRLIDARALASRSRNTPYAGLKLPGRIVATFLRGTPTVLNGKASR